MRRRLPRRHETDMRKYLGDVRCWVNSGKHLLAASISGFDPPATSVNISCCGSEGASAPIKTLV
jgi:hypothetical protein